MTALAGLLKTGDVIRASYEIVGTIGEGASGVVYMAHDVSTPQVTWAVKEIRCRLADAEEEREALERFEKECAILKGLNHPGLPKLIDYFSEGLGHYIVMEFVEGKSLQSMLQERARPFSFEEVKPWLLQLLGILEYLHGQTPPVVFRDLKPSNIMITAGGRVKLIDFGIARHFSPGKEKDTFVMGTPGFSAPEQYGSRQTDARSDVYSLGATMFYLLTSRYPEEFSFTFPPVTQLNPDVPRWFSTLLARCLEPNPEVRIQSCRALKEEMERAYAGPVPPRTPSGPFSIPAAAQVYAGPSLESVAKEFFIALGLCLGAVPLSCFGPLAGVLAFIGWVIFPFVVLHCAQIIWYVLRNRLQGSLAAPIVLGLISLVFFAAPPLVLPVSFLNARKSGQITACKSNLKNIGTALEMYSTDNYGRYPPALSKLTPNYLKMIPTCPSAGMNTYSAGYRSASSPDAYTVFCGGRHHEAFGSAPDYPQYNSTQGLIER